MTIIIIISSSLRACDVCSNNLAIMQSFQEASHIKRRNSTKTVSYNHYNISSAGKLATL